MARAQLRAMTPEAERALGGRESVTIESWPFRVGRESRARRAGEAADERRSSDSVPNNDLYLLDADPVKYVSREHFQIESPGEGEYLVRERGSVCGTQVANAYVGGDRETGECRLEDGNTIAVGGPDSPYVFRFDVID